MVDANPYVGPSNRASKGRGSLAFASHTATLNHQDSVFQHDGTEDFYGLPKWATEPRWLPRHRVAHGLSWIGPASVIIGCVCLLIGLSSESRSIANTGVVLLSCGFAINLLLTIFRGSWGTRHLSARHWSASCRFQFAEVFRSFDKLPSDNGLLDRFATQLSMVRRTQLPASRNSLVDRAACANLQRDPLMYILYLILQLAVMWDYRVLELLERWQAQFGTAVGEWFSALGQCEAS